MKIPIKYIIGLCLLICSIKSEAQVFPPDFQCVRNDTLFWDIPVNTCGTFNSYDIYFSENINGPYALLSSITDQSADSFFHSNPLGTTFYYYFETNANCPGEPILRSDTLNNEPPTRSPITVVSVDGDDIMIDWIASTSPEVTNYIIYRTSPVGALPIDTVDASITTYTDFGADPINQSESYFVLAMDACGNTSVFDLPHFTVFLEEEVDVCSKTIALNWNRYRNWSNDIDQQELWLSVNNAPFTLLETLSAENSTYLFLDTNDGDNYCFYLRTIEANTGIVSLSNINCIDLDIVEPVRQLFLKNVSVNQANEVELTWQWNTDAEVAAVEFEERVESSGFSLVDGYTPFGSLDAETTRTLSGLVDPTQEKKYFKIRTIDDCDSTVTSNEVPTIHLSGLAQENQQNLLNWTAFDRPDGIINSYDIYRIVDGGVSFLETVDGSTTTYSDPVDISKAEEFNICYYVVANAIVTDPDGLEMSVASQSNTFCVEQLSDILAPNAFVPEGINKEFRPRIVFGETVDYQMRIFDRWGNQIFETTNQLEGWNGRDGFFYHPAGVYVYLIKITQTNGRIVEKRGNVALIR